MVLRAKEPDKVLPNGTHHFWTVLLFLIAGGLLLAGFILLNVILIKIGQESTGIGGIVSISVAAFFIFVAGIKCN